MGSKKRLVVAAALAVLGILSGCTSRDSAFQKVHEPPAVPAPPTALEQARAARAEGDKGFALRSDRTQLEGAIKAYERAAALDPSDGDVRARLSRSYYFLADTFFQGEAQKDQLLANFEKGTSWGEEAIVVLSPEFARRAANHERFEDAVKVTDARAIDGLYWYAVNLGKWARAKGIATLLGNKDKVKAVMDRVIEIDPRYFHGAPHRYFGAYYSLLPSIAGRDVVKSREHFEKALEIAPLYVGTRVLYADTYAVKVQNQELFRRLLTEATATPDDAIPEVAPELRSEKAKAAALLQNAGELF